MDNENKNLENNQEEKTYTKEEVDKMIQAEADRRVTQALKTQEQKFNEAAKLANMNQQEKQDYEYNKKLAELQSREEQLLKREMEAEVTKLLSEKDLPQSASQFLVAIDADTTKANVEAFEKMFNEAVKAEVTKKLGGHGLNKSSTKNEGVTKESFRKMSLSQQAEIYRTNPELYKSLTSK